MSSGIPDLAKIVEVDGAGQGSRNSAARWRAAVVIPLLLRSPLGGHAGEREREVEGGSQGRPAHQEVEVAARGGGARG
jgi:hypothetical protein